MAECLTIRSIISRFYYSWSRERKLRADVKRAAAAIIHCQTPELGSHVERCDCGHVTHVKYNSCRHRSCPQCGGGRRADWLEKTSKQLLPCGHVHVIFTVPEELNILWRFNRELFADKLMTAARQTLETLLADDKYLGAKAGIITALHTWGRNLSIHPHAHCLVTAGGVDPDGRFVEPKLSIFLPGGVLKAVFRGKLCESLRNGLRNGTLVVPTSQTEAKCHSLINRLGRVNWNVRVQERYPHGVSVAGYLARYLVGGPMSDKRLCSASSDEIVFRYKDHRDGKEKRMPLSPAEFLTRWFEHVPPRALRMIRRSGLYSNSSGAIREQVREQLAAQSESASATDSASLAASEVCPVDRQRCPLCNTLVSVTVVYRPPSRVFPVVRQSHVYPRPP
jgi:hypothetical protein